jgi:hypothetical protein
MGYLGNSPQNQAFTPKVDYFSGNGSTTAFTLSFPVASVAQVQVVIENVPQNPGDAYTVSGNTITFTSAPPSGTNNIYVYYTSPITTVITPGYGTVGAEQLKPGAVTAPTPTAVSDQANTSTGYFDLPAGTTAQRPGSPNTGMIRYNTTTSSYEAYDGTNWVVVSTTGYTYSADYLLVAGGGAGAGYVGGGGGAGGMLTGTSTLSQGTTYTVVVGAGGSRDTWVGGSNSTALSLTAIGGGRGAQGGGTGSGDIYATSGGSGGGGGSGAATAGASGTVGQGNAGGNSPGTAPNYVSAGGGGKGGVGASPPSTSAGSGGNGGVGGASSITGTSVYYAGGGGGGTGGVPGGTGGNGGGGTGGSWVSPNATEGSANTGGGGGGGGGNGSLAGSGGSGVCILRVLTSWYSGVTTGSPTVTTDGSYTVIKFTSSGSYTA